MLLDRYYATEEPIQKEMAYAVARANKAAERAATDAVLRQFFKLVDGAWAHKKCEALIARFREKSTKAAASAHKRWHGEGNANASETHTNTQSVGNAPQSPVTSNQKEKKKDLSGRPDSVAFETWYAAYPRKEAKAKALSAWERLRPDPVVLLAAVERQKRSGCLRDERSAEGRSLIPLPASWLNARRWEDVGVVTPVAVPKTPEQLARDEASDAFNTLLSDARLGLKAPSINGAKTAAGLAAVGGWSAVRAADEHDRRAMGHKFVSAFSGESA